MDVNERYSGVTLPFIVWPWLARALLAAIVPQTYLAVHTGLGRAFISGLENGKKEPCLRSLEILAVGFEMSISQLFRRL
jgi:transcriptional regulator with XRE-family HTH domain